MTKITNKDLIGDLRGFPIEIAQRMLECTEEQGHKRGIISLQNEVSCAFNWIKTKEGFNFWKEVIRNKNFDLFYDKYPKKHSSLTTIFVTSRKWYKK